MTTAVKIFYHSSVVTAPVSSGSGRYHTDAIQMAKQPYLAREAISATATAAASVPAPKGSRIAIIEVEVGKRVRIEVITDNRVAVADQDSPAYAGTIHFECAEGWSFSVIETV